MLDIVISDGDGQTTVLPLVRDEITIGRKQGNTIRLTERNVSRRHARLERDAGTVRIEDLQSYTGVKVNGRKIDGKVDLKAGDRIRIGDYLLALQTEAATTAGATASIAAPTSPGPPARFVMLSPPAPGAEIALSKGRMRLGRAEDLAGWINHRSISREHAEVVRAGDGYQLVDLGSANGVRINGQQICAAPLRTGDVVELGQVKLRFVAEGELYVFDAEGTMPVAAIELGTPTARPPILAALAILVGAVGLASMLALLSGERHPDRRTVSIAGTSTELVEPPEPTPQRVALETTVVLEPEQASPAAPQAPSVDDSRRARSSSGMQRRRFRDDEDRTRSRLEPRMEAPMVRAPREECDIGSPGYTRCVIRTQEGRARSAQDLLTLIAAYRQINDRAAAFRNMRTFIRRYPTHARADALRQILNAHGVTVER